MTCKSTLVLVTCIVSSMLAQEDGAVVFQEHDPAAIQEILESLLNQSVTLKEHREQQQHRTKTQILLKESIHLVADDSGEEFVIYAETIYGANKIKVVSYFHDDDTTTKLLLSLIGGGNVKSITITKPQSNKT